MSHQGSPVSDDRRYLVWSLVLIVVALGLMFLLMPSGRRVAFDQRRSALRTTPDGIAAFARSLERYDRRVEFRFESWERIPPQGRVEVLMEPVEPPTAPEVSRVLGWVEEGGVLVYSPGWGPDMADSLGLVTGLYERSDSSVMALHPWTESVASRPTYVRGAEADPEVGELIGDLDPLLLGFDRSWVGLSDTVRSVWWTPLVTHFGTGGGVFTEDGFEADSADTPVPYVTLGWLERGQGGVLILAEGLAVSNAVLGASPEALVAARAILSLTEPGDRILFSEYHQGIYGEGSRIAETVGSILGTRVGRVLLWLGIVAGLWLLSRGRRFGAPIPRAPPPRRSPLEHVSALADIHRTARAHRLVAERLVRGAARRAHVQGGGRGEPPTDLLERWRRQPSHRDAADRALAALQADPPQLMQLAHALDELIPPRSMP